MQYQLKITTFRVSFMCLKPGTLPPYLGSTIRGIMGHCFRKSACTEAQTKCFTCHKRENCTYVRYYCNTGKEGGAINPYAIWVLHNGKTQWQSGDECVFDLTLFGNVAEEAEMYLHAIIAMEQRGWGVSKLPFKLVRISDVLTGKLIYVPECIFTENLTSDFIKIPEKEAQTVFISFDTPLRIVSGGKLCYAPSFKTLIQFIMRRFSLISQVHANQMLEWDETKMLELAGQVETVNYQFRDVNFQRYSITQENNKLELPAIEGWIMYKGNISLFMPILEAGKCIHVGKGATIGFGHYETFYA